MRRFLLSVVVLWLIAFHSPAQTTSRLKHDQSIVFFPAFAHRDGKNWDVEIRGWVFEQERHPRIASLLRHYLGLQPGDLTAEEENYFNERTKLFFLDALHGRKISIEIGGKVYDLGKSKSDGEIKKTLHLPAEDIDPLMRETEILRTIFQAKLRTDDQRIFGGSVQFVQSEGISIVSDIDDTIKVTGVRNRKDLLKNTFCRGFKPVDGMADLYRSWTTNQNVTFHYVSASPLQLFSPLESFLHDNHFPEGPVHLRAWHWKGDLLPHHTPIAEAYKISVIEPLLKEFPRRRFILVGDSGEFDPEAYGKLARKYPKQIVKIFIRDVTQQTSDNLRYAKAFENVSTNTWEIFKNPSEIRLP